MDSENQSCESNTPAENIENTGVTDEELPKVLDEFGKSTYEDSNPQGDARLDELEAVGYLHNISPLRKGKYFDFQLQAKDRTVRGVCFSPPKRKLFLGLGESNSPVKIKKFRISTTSNTEDLVIGNDGSIDRCDDVDFEKEDIPSTMNISNAMSVCSGQTISVTGKVAHIYPTKEVGSKNLQMRNAVIVDPSGHTKLALWEEYINKVEKGNTYTFNNVRVRKDKLSGEVYLSTVQSETVIKLAAEFEDVLPLVVLESQSVDVKVVGLDSVQSYLGCDKCGKKIERTGQRHFIQCLHCGFKQKEDLAVIHWFANVKVVSKSSSQADSNRFVLTFFENSIKKIVEMSGMSQVDVSNLRKDIIEDIFYEVSVISVTYNKRNHVIESVDNATL